MTERNIASAIHSHLKTCVSCKGLSFLSFFRRKVFKCQWFTFSATCSRRPFITANTSRVRSNNSSIPVKHLQSHEWFCRSVSIGSAIYWTLPKPCFGICISFRSWAGNLYLWQTLSVFVFTLDEFNELRGERINKPNYKHNTVRFLLPPNKRHSHFCWMLITFVL